MPSPPKGFNTNIFINCPFDPAYSSLLRPLLFTILYLGYTPKISSETLDSAQQRIDKICGLIKASKYSIHDLSRMRAAKKGEFARHNMPFELGVDYGIRRFGGPPFAQKKFLILEREKYDYSKALSDLAGIDIRSHGDIPKNLVRAIRNWFVDTIKAKNVAPASIIWNHFEDFMSAFDAERRKEGFDSADIYQMPVTEFMSFIKQWLP